MNRTLLSLLAAAASIPSIARAQPACSARPTAPALDHVVLVTADLERGAAGFAREGFRLKPGRLHANNLLNRHVKFRDGTSIELMTVVGAPGDAMAERYVRLLRGGEGGVYVALTTADADDVQHAATSLRLPFHRSASGPWRFVGFDSASAAAAVFFSSGGLPANDPDSLVTHRASVSGLTEAWLEGGAELGALLDSLGAARCGATRSPDGVAGERWALRRGSVVVVPATSGRRPRVLGVVLGGAAPSAGIARPHPRFWIAYERPK